LRQRPIPGNTLTVLQAGRAVAAFAVVLNHVAISSADFVGAVPGLLGEVMKRGFLGVDFFFVLSGFIIYYTSRWRAGPEASGLGFAGRRLVRIFVPYLPISLVLIAAYLALPGLSASGRDWGWAASLTLLPAADPPALGVAWTLQHELVFYLLFAALYFSGGLVVGCGYWVLGIVAVNVVGPELDRPMTFLFHPINLEFIFGMVAARVAVQGGIGNRLLAALSLSALLIFILLGGKRDQSVVFGLAVAFALVPLVRMELAGKLRAGPGLVFFGGASYALYLIHDPLISLTSRVAARVPGLDTWVGAVALGVGCSAAAAAAYHVGFERPALARARRWIAALPQVTTGPRATARTARGSAR
jgi:peptidoglycan/LPS O-acetylase OafA/YrhL